MAADTSTSTNNTLQNNSTTTTLTSALLTATGLRVGTFTSPDLHAINERIAVNGEAIVTGTGGNSKALQKSSSEAGGAVISSLNSISSNLPIAVDNAWPFANDWARYATNRHHPARRGI